MPWVIIFRQRLLHCLWQLVSSAQADPKHDSVQQLMKQRVISINLDVDRVYLNAPNFSKKVVDFKGLKASATCKETSNANVSMCIMKASADSLEMEKLRKNVKTLGRVPGLKQPGFLLGDTQ